MAANQGHREAQYQLALCYYLGNGTPVDREKAFAWFARLSGDQKEAPPPALRQEKAQAVYLGSAADTPERNLFSGDRYYYGYGVIIDQKKAFQYYQVAAEAGNAQAQYMLGQCCFQGYGTEKNIEKAAQENKKNFS
jgi:TPR repeat protein